MLNIVKHKLVQISDLIKETSLCRGQQLPSEVTTGQSAKDKCLWSAQAYIGHLYHTPSPRLKAHCRRRGGKIVEEDWNKTVSSGHKTITLMNQCRL